MCNYLTININFTPLRELSEILLFLDVLRFGYMDVVCG